MQKQYETLVNGRHQMKKCVFKVNTFTQQKAGQGKTFKSNWFKEAQAFVRLCLYDIDFVYMTALSYTMSQELLKQAIAVKAPVSLNLLFSKV